MANRRMISWSSSLREVRGTRQDRAGVREERLRSTSGLRGRSGHLAAELTSWRGRSGRRYVVGVHPAAEPGVSDLTDAVVIAVMRSGDGTASVLGAASQEGSTPGRARRRWLSRMQASGATELHVHLLAADAAERGAVVEDLVSAAS